MANDSQTVYLVETGCYSSHYAVFTTREAAELYGANYGDSDYQIIEAVLDAETPNLPSWQCVLALDTGDELFARKADEHPYKPHRKSEVNGNRVSAWGQSEEHARKNVADFRMLKLLEMEREVKLAESRSANIAQQFEDMETSRFIENRNKAMIAGGLMKPGSVEVLDEPFVPPTQDQKAMMDPFYQLYVAGVSDRSTEAPRFTDAKVSIVIESPRYSQRYIEVNGQIEIDRDSHEMGQ